MRLRSASAWRDPRVIAWFLAAFSGTLLASAILGDASALGDILLGVVGAGGSTAAVAATMIDWPPDKPPWRILIPIFAAYAGVLVTIWVFVRLR